MSGFITKISSGFGKLGLKMAKRSPEILMGGGFILGGTGVVLACKATLKATEVLQEHRAALQEVNEAVELGIEDYTEKDRKRDVALVYGKTAGRFVKLYFPALMCEIGAAACFLSAFGILKRRNAVLTAAYAELLKSYNNYRGKVIEKYGDEADKEIISSGREKIVDVDKDGNVTKETDSVASDCSQYARFFDSSCPDWVPNSEYNLAFLMRAQDYFNDRLNAVGNVFLNEVYDYLGFERTAAGAVVGWCKGSKYADENGISFGIHDMSKKANRRFVNGLENVILLDFNVDGVIYDLI